jgi:hypothetical protein
MAATNYVKQTVLPSSIATTAWTPWQGNWARYWGRSQPMHATSGVQTILGEVASGVYTEDMAGLAYGAETLWVRVQAEDASDGLATGGENKLYWLGVPATLPAGFTVRNTRTLGATTKIEVAAGYRSVRAFTFVTPTFYNGTGLPASYPRYLSSTATIGLSSGQTRSFSCARADLSYDATQNYYVKDHGDIGDLLPDHGTIAWWMQHDYSVTYDWWDPTDTWLSGIGMSHVFWMCPRVDIPLPFSASYQNLVAPGGVLTGGNVPGY